MSANGCALQGHAKTDQRLERRPQESALFRGCCPDKGGFFRFFNCAYAWPGAVVLICTMRVGLCVCARLSVIACITIAYLRLRGAMCRYLLCVCVLDLGCVRFKLQVL